MTQSTTTLIVGGYGSVGRVIATELTDAVTATGSDTLNAPDGPVAPDAPEAQGETVAARSPSRSTPHWSPSASRKA